MYKVKALEPCTTQKRPTKRAPDVWDSAAFSSIFLASAFSCPQTESTPAHTQVTQTVGLLRSIFKEMKTGRKYAQKHSAPKQIFLCDHHFIIYDSCM